MYFYAHCLYIQITVFLPCDENSNVMVCRMSVTLRIEVFLPSTEACESGISMVNNLQPFLKTHIKKLNSSDFYGNLAKKHQHI